MLARRSLGDSEGSKREASAYRWYQRDESAQQMTLDFRKRDAASNYASQPIRGIQLAMIKTSQLAISLGLMAAMVLLASCKEKKQAEVPKKAEYAVAAPKQDFTVRLPVPEFKDVTQEAGITFVGDSGADGRKLMPETMVWGVGMIDYDGDGWLDLVMVNGRPWDTTKKCPPLLTIYHNERNGKFRDTTSELGLAASLRLWHGGRYR